MAKVINEVGSDICVLDMNDGDVAVITNWSYDGHIGEVVQRYKDVLISIGQRSGLCWPNIFEGSESTRKSCKVRILKEGTQIEL